MIDAKKMQELKTWLGQGAIDVFGVPMSYRSEIAAALARDFGGVLISSGDIIRNAEENIVYHKIISSGHYFPSGYFYQLVLPYLRDEKFAGRPLILNAVGRSDGEENLVTKVLHDAMHDMKAVVILNMSEAEAFARRDRNFKAGVVMHEEDRELPLFQVKMREYRAKTWPVLARYRGRSLAVDVNGEQDANACYAECLENLYYFMTHK